jgi:hypothetical protein
LGIYIHDIYVHFRVFCEKVKGLEGSLEFLNAAGFREQTIANNDTGVEEKYLIFNKDNIDSIETLTVKMFIHIHRSGS